MLYFFATFFLYSIVWGRKQKIKTKEIRNENISLSKIYNAKSNKVTK